MDLSFGLDYEAFRTEVRNFLRAHASDAPSKQRDYRSARALAW